MNKHLSEVTNEDCMEGMARYPDKYFDLAIVDPPYGININESIGRRKGEKHSGYKKVKWDNEIPSSIYFIELFRVSKNQIIWGGNYFLDYLNSTPCFIMWDKGFSELLTFAQFELAWTSFKTSCKKFNHSHIQNNKQHPTQKPVALYKWLLSNYAKQGDKILDTHLGSGSNRIAAYEMGFDFTAFELDAEYFEAQEKRYKAHIAQLKLELI
jgi:site-specific DNA-methyltransferase (adenine-specific)